MWCLPLRLPKNIDQQKHLILYFDSTPFRPTVTNKTQETNYALGLSGDSSQGKVIGFAQFDGSKFYKEVPDGFSNFWDLATDK